MSCTFFFFFSFLVKLLPRPKILDAPRCLDRGYEKILGIFFSIFQKSLEILQFGKLCKKHFFNFPFNLHIIIVVLASYVRCKMAVYQYDDCKLQSTIKQQSLIKSRWFFDQYLLKFYDKHFGEALFKQGLQEIVNFEWWYFFRISFFKFWGCYYDVWELRI